MSVNKLTSIGGSSVGVVLPLEDLRDEELVVDEGDDVKPADDTWLRVRRFDRGAWQVVRADTHDYPAFHEKPAYAETPKPSAKA